MNKDQHSSSSTVGSVIFKLVQAFSLEYEGAFHISDFPLEQNKSLNISL